VTGFTLSRAHGLL